LAKRASERFREIAVIKTKDDLLKQVGTALGSPAPEESLKFIVISACEP
jgi:hypothetical protein